MDTENKTADQEQYLKGVNEELYKRNLELAIKNKTLSLLRELYQISILTLKPKELAKKLTETVQSILDYELVGVMLINEESETIDPLSFSMSEDFNKAEQISGYRLENIQITSPRKNPIFSRTEKGIVHLSCLCDIWQKIIPSSALEEAEDRAKIKSSVLYPLTINMRTFGYLVLSMNRKYDEIGQFEKESMENIVNVISVALDKAVLYQQILIANEKLKELDKQKTEFVSMASHQLRSPLTAIKGYSSMLLEGSFGELSEKSKEAVDRIFDSSQRLVMVIEDFLNITRIELGKMKYDMVDLDLRDLAEKMTAEMTPTANKKGLEIAFESNGKDFIMLGDIGKVSQIITNLIDNSIKYTPKGSVTVSVSGNGEKIRFMVSDTGVGLEAGQIPKLFRKFVRANDAGKVNYSGTGLGLYVVKQMAEAHNGSVWAESDGIGKGSRFIVEFSAKK